MQERNVILTWEAIYDVADIYDYIERDFGMDRAEQFEDDIKEQFVNLKSMAGAFGNTNIYYRGYVIFKKPFPPSIIFYIIKDPEREVHILRVLREESSWRAILRREQHYTYPNR